MGVIQLELGRWGRWGRLGEGVQRFLLEVEIDYGMKI
jgi:hypothetical protein